MCKDITYQSLAKAFNQNLVHHQETINRMYELTRQRNWLGTQNSEQTAAMLRMALFPENSEVLFVAEDIWVVDNPILSSNSPQIFLKLASSPWCVWKENFAFFLAFLLYSRKCYTG